MNKLIRYRTWVNLVILLLMVATLVELHLTRGGRYQVVPATEPYFLRIDTRTGKITSLVVCPPNRCRSSIEMGFRVSELNE